MTHATAIGDETLRQSSTAFNCGSTLVRFGSDHRIDDRRAPVADRLRHAAHGPRVTRLSTRAGLATAAAAAGDFLVAQEGAFGTHLLQRDLVETPLVFDAGGIVETDELALAEAPGWGLSFRDVT